VAVPDLVTGEVLKIPCGEAIGTVKNNLDLGVRCRTSGTNNNARGCGSSGNGVNAGCSSESGGGTDPDELLDGVIEVEADGVIGAGTGAGLLLLLKLVDEVLVCVLGKLATLGGVEVDVVGVHGKTAAGKIGSGS